MSDLIDRQAAIDEIDEWIKAFLENGHKESAADASLIQDGIIQLPSAQPEIRYYGQFEIKDPVLISEWHWIPVSERLPEDGQDCLVTEVITNGMKSVLIAKFANDLYKIDKYDFARRKGEHGWFCYDYEHGRCYDVDVIAWMPLPEPMELEED